MDVVFALVCLLLSLGIGLSPWPRRAAVLGPLSALMVAVLLLVGDVALARQGSSWFALTVSLELGTAQATSGWLAAVWTTWAGLTGGLAVAALDALPGLAHGLAVNVLLMFGYLLYKGIMLALIWLYQRWLLPTPSYALSPVTPRRRAISRYLGGLCLVLGLGVAFLPEDLMAAPTVAAIFSRPGWVGLWILLLELRLWFRFI